MTGPAEQAPTEITFITWDADTDGVAIRHDGQTVWTESSFDSLDQYLRYLAPLGQPVILRAEVSE